MDHEEANRLRELISNPPAGSKIEAALKYGVDLSLNVRSLELTPTERVRELERVLRFMEDLQRAGRTDQ